MNQTHFVEFFDSFTMKNRTELCRMIEIQLGRPGTEDMATVEVDLPIQKRIRVPITCLICRYTGQRLPFSAEDLVAQSFEIDVREF